MPDDTALRTSKGPARGSDAWISSRSFARRPSGGVGRVRQEKKSRGRRGPWRVRSVVCVGMEEETKDVEGRGLRWGGRWMEWMDGRRGGDGGC